MKLREFDNRASLTQTKSYKMTLLSITSCMRHRSRCEGELLVGVNVVLMHYQSLATQLRGQSYCASAQSPIAISKTTRACAQSCFLKLNLFIVSLNLKSIDPHQ